MKGLVLYVLGYPKLKISFVAKCNHTFIYFIYIYKNLFIYKKYNKQTQTNKNS